MGLRSYESVANIWRRIEDWNGASDPQYRGTGGLVFVRGCGTAKEPRPGPLGPTRTTLCGSRPIRRLTQMTRRLQ